MPSAVATTPSLNVPAVVPAVNRPDWVIVPPGTDIDQETETSRIGSPDSAIAVAAKWTCPPVRVLP